MHAFIFNELHRPLSRRVFLRRGAATLGGIWAVPGFAGAAENKPAKPRRIGFVDDNLENYHSNVFLQALRGPLKERGFAVTGCTGLKEAEGRVWAEKNNVPWFGSVKDLDQQADFYMVLAPSTPETHLELCRRVFPFQKPVYVDKTFAPDLGTAKAIFERADRYGTPMQTTSALRYTNVQEHVKSLPPGAVQHAITWGGGGSFGEYAIHPLEFLISMMGDEVESILRRGPDNRAQLLINFSRDRTGVVNVYTQSSTPFAASITTEKGTKYFEVDVSKIFVNNMASILDFFIAGQANIDRKQTLAIMRILDAAKDPAARKGFLALSDG